MNFSLITLGELLSSQNEIIKRNAFSILKQLQKERDNTQVNYLFESPDQTIKRLRNEI